MGVGCVINTPQELYDAIRKDPLSEEVDAVIKGLGLCWIRKPELRPRIEKVLRRCNAIQSRV